MIVSHAARCTFRSALGLRAVTSFVLLDGVIDRPEFFIGFLEFSVCAADNDNNG
jgi:hypothetical protein